MRITKAQKEIIKRRAVALAERVRETGEFPIALIIEEAKKTVKIKCPYCERIHIHGTVGGDPEGHRVPHCWELSDMPEYIVKRPESTGNGYILFR